MSIEELQNWHLKHYKASIRLCEKWRSSQRFRANQRADEYAKRAEFHFDAAKSIEDAQRNKT